MLYYGAKVGSFRTVMSGNVYIVLLYVFNFVVFVKDWVKESKEGYKQSDLASQCHHR